MRWRLSVSIHRRRNFTRFSRHCNVLMRSPFSPSGFCAPGSPPCQPGTEQPCRSDPKAYSAPFCFQDYVIYRVCNVGFVLSGRQYRVCLSGLHYRVWFIGSALSSWCYRVWIIGPLLSRWCYRDCIIRFKLSSLYHWFEVNESRPYLSAFCSTK